MCGIVGYVGKSNAVPILLEGLSALEYRGYDSAGICVMKNGTPTTIKEKGRLSDLKQAIAATPAISSALGIGHTRWATHGAPSAHNAHPHSSENDFYTVVHNGIIENYISLKEMLLEQGIRFQSETDTEVIAHLLNHNHTGNPMETIFKTIRQLEGSYALGIICKAEPDTLYAIRCESPLIVGKCSHGTLLASDITALLPHTGQAYLLENHQLCVMNERDFFVYSEEQEQITPTPFPVDWTVESAQKQGYDHFMLKEIYEQATAVKQTVQCRLFEEGICFNELPQSNQWLMGFRSIQIAACGSAYHVALLGKDMLETYVRLPVSAEIASEYRYRNTLTNPQTLFIAISQSGETADTLAALRKAKKNGACCVAICNVMGSSLAREADYVLYTYAGPEISVATTKAYSAQLALLYLLTLSFSHRLGHLGQEEWKEILEQLKALPKQISRVIADTPRWVSYAEQFHNAKQFFFLGRGMDCFTGMEGALKLKEISYLPAESYPAGELKHGPISLIEEGTPVIVLSTDKRLFPKVLSNLREVQSRGAQVLLITNYPIGETDIAGEVYLLPDLHPLLMPSVSVLPLQAIAYHIAKVRGCDIDKPRNLAKSVTVE